MSVNLNLNRTNFQAQLRSKPLRENEIDIENAVNDLQSQVSALATAATGTFAEITNARDYHSVLRERLRSSSKSQHNIVVSGGSITPQGSPNMTVHAAAGEAIVDGIACKWVASDSGTITAPTTARYDVVVANSDNTLSVVAGTNTSAPFYPDIADSQVPLAVLSLTAGSSVINTTMITDARANLQHYFRNGADWEHIWNPGKRVRRQVFTASGTWYKPTGVTQAKVTLVGAGGAGGNRVLLGGGGGGGGAGAVRKSIITVSADVSVIVGVTGNTSFGSFVANAGSVGGNASGGTGGAGGNGGGYGAGGGGGGGSGGTGAGADGGIGGYPGEDGANGGGSTPGTGGTSIGGSGVGSFAPGIGGTVPGSGASDFGGGGGGAAGYNGNGGSGGNNSSPDGGDGEGYGAGGGGSAQGGTPGSGGAGLCIVEWEE